MLSVSRAWSSELHPQHCMNQAWEYTYSFSAFRRCRQENQKFKVFPRYIESWKSVQDTWTSVSKKTKKISSHPHTRPPTHLTNQSNNLTKTKPRMPRAGYQQPLNTWMNLQITFKIQTTAPKRLCFAENTQSLSPRKESPWVKHLCFCHLAPVGVRMAGLG